MEAQVFLTGKLGGNAEVTQFDNGNAVIKFSVACNHVYANSQGEQVKETTWHECKKFVSGDPAPLAKHLQKGKHVSIFGALRYDEYEQAIAAANPVRQKRAYVDVKGLTLS